MELTNGAGVGSWMGGGSPYRFGGMSHLLKKMAAFSMTTLGNDVRVPVAFEGGGKDSFLP